MFHQSDDTRAGEHERSVFEPDRSLLVRDGGIPVAHATAHTRELTVPGGTVPAAHVTGVAVATTHRRQRLLTRLMRHQLRELRDTGREPVALLWASEGRIYPRFGYGLAAQRLEFDADLTELRLPAPADAAGGRLRAGTPTALRAELARLYDRQRAGRPGWSSRDERWWRYVLHDPVARRNGFTERRAVLHEGPEGVDGYALWRAKGDWDRGGPRGVVQVDEVVAENAAAYQALWRMLCSVDLTRRLSYRFAALDEPLLRLANEPSRLGAQLADALWVRIVDLPAALAARRYATPIDVVLEVSDDLIPENTGRWRLTGGPDEARCVPTDRPADLVCGIRALGELFLGGTSLTSLFDAGQVRSAGPGVIETAGTAFGWYRAPAAMEVF